MCSLITARCGILAAGLFLIAGCSGGKGESPKTFPVSGTVMYKGKAVVGATVSFMTEGSSRSASGITDSEGKFQLTTTKPNDGAVPGEHVVTVSKVTGGAQTSNEDMTAMLDDPSKLAQASDKQNKSKAVPKALLPAKYAHAKTTPLKETVTEDGPNEFVLQLAD